MQALIEVIEKHLISICLGIFGGALRDLSSTDFSFRRFWVGIGTTAFVSILMSFMVEELTCPFTIKAVMIAMCGYASNAVLDVLNKAIINRIKKMGKSL